MKYSNLLKMLVSVLLLTLLSIPAASSSFVEYLVTAEILSTESKNGKTFADLKVVKCQNLESGYGGEPFQTGRVFRKVALDKPVKAGQVRKIKYMLYSAMTPTGPMSGETWTVQD